MRPGSDCHPPGCGCILHAFHRSRGFTIKSYHDIVGDGGSRIAEQVDEQQARIVKALTEKESAS